jgi:hypothetical protein
MPEQPNSSETAGQAPAQAGMRDIIALVAAGNSSIRASDYALDEDGRLRVRKDASPIHFCFAYRGVDFDALMDTAPEADISLSAELGKVPYSMETGAGRHLTRRIVEATAGLPGGRIDVSASQDMSIVATARPPLPLTPASIMATITALLLDLGPYIDLLRGVVEAANGRNMSGFATASPDAGSAYKSEADGA